MGPHEETIVAPRDRADRGAAGRARGKADVRIGALARLGEPSWPRRPLFQTSDQQENDERNMRDRAYADRRLLW